jgi:rRNA pseudouridine-1189 N-methylase Emg1 (Nep1/Mra1 family)
MEEHYWLIKKKKKVPELYRPDTVHQSLMALLDSPLGK